MHTSLPIGNPDAFDLASGHQYTGYRQETTYEYDPGVVVLPLASHEPKTVTVRLHGGFGIRAVTVRAAKRGSPPILPAATDTDRDTLISNSVVIPLPAFAGDAPTFNWVATGTYLYVTTKGGPRIPGRDLLPAGQYPFPLPLQDRAAEALFSPGGGIEAIAEQLPRVIPTGNFLWPFTVYPPAFFNSILLRDNDKEGISELQGGSIP